MWTSKNHADAMTEVGCAIRAIDGRGTGARRLLRAPAKRGGNRGHWVVREVVNGPWDILSTGCQWRAIAKTSAAALDRRCTIISTCGAGTARSIASTTRCHAQCRQAASREASPTAAIIDSQSVKSAEKGAARD